MPPLFSKVFSAAPKDVLPDPLTGAAATVTWVILLNKPIYPLYVWYLTGEGVLASLGTLVAIPFYLGILFLVGRSTLAARAALVLLGTADTLFETKLFGQGAGTELFFAACIMLVTALFEAKDVWWQRGLAVIVFAVFIVSRWSIGPPLRTWSDAGLTSLLHLNAFAVACLMAFIALRFAGIARDGERRQDDNV